MSDMEIYRQPTAPMPADLTCDTRRVPEASSRHYNWEFNDSPHTGVFTTKRVMSGEDPITRVFHDLDDGAWQFHGPEESDPNDMAYVCLDCIVDKDATINELHDLPVGWAAWRESVTAPWVRELAPPHDDED